MGRARSMPMEDNGCVQISGWKEAQMGESQRKREEDVDWTHMAQDGVFLAFRFHKRWCIFTSWITISFSTRILQTAIQSQYSLSNRLLYEVKEKSESGFQREYENRPVV